MTKREFLDIVFDLAPTEANRIMDAFDEYVESTEPHWIPVTEEPMNDLISRQQAIDISKDLTITVEDYEMHNQAVMNYCADIMQLPSIQPKRGRWIDGYCSECGAHAPFWAMASTYHKSNFCPNCGADMRGEQE